MAAPIESQGNGVEKMIYLQSINANDGTMTIQTSFEIGTDPDMNTVFTQNRVAAATAALAAADKAAKDAEAKAKAAAKGPSGLIKIKTKIRIVRYLSRRKMFLSKKFWEASRKAVVTVSPLVRKNQIKNVTKVQ